MGPEIIASSWGEGGAVRGTVIKLSSTKLTWSKEKKLLQNYHNSIRGAINAVRYLFLIWK